MQVIYIMLFNRRYQRKKEIQKEEIQKVFKNRNIV